MSHAPPEWSRTFTTPEQVGPIPPLIHHQCSTIHHQRSPQPHSAELLAHRERVTRHAQGVLSSLNEQKSLVQTLAEKLQTQVCVCEGRGSACIRVCDSTVFNTMQAERFSEQMSSLVSSLGAASNTSRLVATTCAR